MRFSLLVANLVKEQMLIINWIMGRVGIWDTTFGGSGQVGSFKTGYGSGRVKKFRSMSRAGSFSTLLGPWTVL